MILTTDLTKGPEVFFQPNICGIDCAGISETIAYCVKKYPEEL